MKDSIISRAVAKHNGASLIVQGVEYRDPCVLVAAPAYRLESRSRRTKEELLFSVVDKRTCVSPVK